MTTQGPQNAPTQPLPAEDTVAVPRLGFVPNTLIILAAQGGRTILAVVLEICYARLLGPAGRGQLTLSLMIIALASVVGGLGGEIPIVLWTADHRKGPAGGLPVVYFCGLTASGLVGILWVITFYVWAPSFLRGITPHLALVVLASIPLFILFSFMAATLTGAERFTERSGILLGQQFAVVIVVVVLLLGFHGHAASALLANFMGTLAASLAAIIVLRKTSILLTPISLNKGTLRDGLSLGLRGQLGNLVSFFNYRLDVFILNYFRNTAAVGIYSLGVIISEALWQVPNAVSTALLPRTARDQSEGSSQFTCLVIRQVLAITTVGAVIVGRLAPFVVPRVFGARFSGSVAAIWLLLPGIVGLAVSKVACADLAGRHRPEYGSLGAVICLVITVVLDFLLIPSLGIPGAAIASSAAYLTEMLVVVTALCSVARLGWKDLFPRWKDLAYYEDLVNRLKTLVRQLFLRKAA